MKQFIKKDYQIVNLVYGPHHELFTFNNLIWSHELSVQGNKMWPQVHVEGKAAQNLVYKLACSKQYDLAVQLIHDLAELCIDAKLLNVASSS